MFTVKRLRTALASAVAVLTFRQQPCMWLGHSLLSSIALSCTCVQRYLEMSEFEMVFSMTPEEFYRLAEWKRNDVKSRAGLF